jgi:hypothetical protein
MTASATISINRAPRGGSCGVLPSNGISYETSFLVYAS